MSGKHYVFDDNKSKQEALTKDEVYNAIYEVTREFPKMLVYILTGGNPLTSTAELYEGVTAEADFPSEDFPYVWTGECTDMHEMFHGCYGLNEVRGLFTEKNENFKGMFHGCTSLIKISDLDTRNGKNLNTMFTNCSSLTEDNFPKLDTHNATDMGHMFDGCSALTKILELDTSKNQNFQGMFYNCSSLTEVPELDTHNGINFKHMFHGCAALTKVPNLDLRNAAGALDQTFAYCSSLTEIPDLDLRGITGENSMFYLCNSLTHIRDNPYAPEGSRWQANFNITFGPCPLDRESILKVFEGLQVVTDKAISISATTNSYLSAEDKAIATNKGWTINVWNN